MNEEEIELIPVAKSEELNDGVQIVKTQHDKFLKELNWDKFSVYDYIDSLQSEIQTWQDTYIDLKEKHANLVALLTLKNNESFWSKLFK